MLAANIVFGQEKCALRSIETKMAKEEPALYKDYLENRNSTLTSNNRLSKTSGEEIFVIPVVVHIMHDPAHGLGVQSNLSENQILSQIKSLNLDYRRLNKDTIYTPSEFLTVAGDSRIVFVLATKDPNGNATNGIVRKPYANSTNFNDNNNDESMKALSKWPQDKYLNIWIVNSIINGTLGYAYLPSMVTNATFRNKVDGLVIGSRYFGNKDFQKTGEVFFLDGDYNLGRTATHELGHYLNLEHTWGNGGCNSSDFVDDTPVASSATYGCPGAKVTQCSSRNMIENYLDYTDDLCMNIFTNGQIARMRNAITSYIFRKNMTTPENLIATGATYFIPDSMFYYSGNNQVVPEFKSVANPLKVKLVNAKNEEVIAIKTKFTFYDSNNNKLADTTVVSNNNGLASYLPPLTLARGNYTVKAESDSLKGSPITFNLSVVESVNKSFTFGVYPNPISPNSTLKINFNLPYSRDIKISFVDNLGRVVNQKLIANAISSEYEIPIKSLSQGIYTMFIESDGEFYKTRVIIAGK